MKEKTLKKQIDNICKVAAESGYVFPFPWIYKSFKEIGIASYSLDIESGKMFIIHKDGTLEEHAPKKNFVFGSFKIEHIIEALQKHQKGETSYEEWLHEMARAGVYRYIVTMANDVVVYLNKDNTQAYVEHVSSV